MFFFQKQLGIFHPRKHVLPWIYGYDNISPCETIMFTACRKMQNIQCLSGSGGSCKYCCKYVGNIDKNNYCTVSKSADGILIRQEIVLQNTQHVTYDKFQQAEWEKKRNWKHPQGTVTSVDEVWNHILKYLEVITNLNVVMTQTTSL